MVNGAVVRGLLKATTAPTEADAFVLAVPTPFDAERQPDLTFLEAAARSIAPGSKKGKFGRC